MSEDMMDYQSMVERAMKGVVRDALLKVGEDGLPAEHHLYITFRTQDDGVDITDRPVSDVDAVILRSKCDVKMMLGGESILADFQQGIAHDAFHRALDH